MRSSVVEDKRSSTGENRDARYEPVLHSQTSDLKRSTKKLAPRPTPRRLVPTEGWLPLLFCLVDHFCLMGQPQSHFAMESRGGPAGRFDYRKVAPFAAVRIASCRVPDWALVGNLVDQRRRIPRQLVASAGRPARRVYRNYHDGDDASQ